MAKEGEPPGLGARQLRDFLRVPLAPRHCLRVRQAVDPTEVWDSGTPPRHCAPWRFVGSLVVQMLSPKHALPGTRNANTNDHIRRRTLRGG